MTIDKFLKWILFLFSCGLIEGDLQTIQKDIILSFETWSLVYNIWGLNYRKLFRMLELHTVNPRIIGIILTYIYILPEGKLWRVCGIIGVDV